MFELSIGTRIKFNRELSDGPTEESWANLYANKGDQGEITGHDCWEGHMVKRNSYILFAIASTQRIV